MKTRTGLFMFAIVCSCVLFTVTAFAGKRPAKGETFPEIQLSAPSSPEYAAYLGVAADKPFRITEIKADLVLVQVFSMYCPICQGDASNVNVCFVNVNKDIPGVNLKFIGIGAGNSPFEVDFYKNKYSVKFPLFPDGDFKLHKILGEVGTPYFWLIDLKNGGKILYADQGAIHNPEEFLKTLKTEIGKRGAK